MVKLTPELIEESRQFINPVRDRELCLRGYKIPLVENLGATYDQFDTIDLSDNDLKKLENIPVLYRLKYLFLSSNRISYIDPKLGENLPNLTTIILTNNSILELGDLDPLAAFPKLEYLSLLTNPVTHKPQYRLYVIHKIPQLRVLDFRRIKLNERNAAKELFKGKKGTALKEQIVKKSKIFTVGEVPNKASMPAVLPTRTPEEIRAIQDAIANAKSFEEVERLQRMLQSGQIPNGSLNRGAAAAQKSGAGGEHE